MVEVFKIGKKKFWSCLHLWRMNAIHKPANFYRDWYLCDVALQGLGGGKGFSGGLWNKSEIEHRGTQSNRKYYHWSSEQEQRSHLWKAERKLPTQFLSYYHVTNGLALIMKGKAERNKELATNEKRVKITRRWLIVKDPPNSWRRIF